ncbi:MAG TPA: hypothetical protein VEG64_17395 [Candidatus Sulfotelmatobacter sp.]|nr:hypothetical protein [Candidatus Sulfotelmatobacter sp.]
MNLPDTLRNQLGRAQRIAALFGIAGAVVLGIAFAFGNREQVMHSYLLAYAYWVSIPLGCMAILMLHHLTGGWWGYPIRRILEAGTRTLGAIGLLFLPLLAGMHRLYPWYGWPHTPEVTHNSNLHFKAIYLTPPLFTVRAVVYFAIWLLLAHFLNKWSEEQDRTGDPRLESNFEALSGPGLILWGLCVTYASVDWVMSLEPLWFSTIYGMIFMVVEALIAMAFVIFVLRQLSDHEPISKIVTPSQFNDLGNLMLAFVMLWAYLGFSQFLIIWAGNIKDEIPWYLARAFGGWGAVAAVLIALHFAVPFLLLLQRGVKRRLQVLSVVAGMMLVLSLLDVYWLVAPAYEKAGPQVHWVDLFALIGIGGIWLAVFFAQLQSRALLPLHDPRFKGALQHEHGD